MIEKFKQARDLIVDLKNEGIIGYNASSPNEFQMDDSYFFEKFTDYQISKRGDAEYPYKIITEIDGIQIFTILTEEEYKKYVLKEAI